MSTQVWPYPGSRWWKFDFHTHTPESKDTPWNPLIGQASELTPRQWLLKYMEAGLDCVAITDHNSGAWVDRLKAAYRELEQERPAGFCELHLFPGVEISVQAGFHLLAILDLSASTSDIDTLLGKVDYDGTKGDSDGVTRKGAAEVVRAILDAGGIPIPAHVDDAKGLLRLDGSGGKKAALDANTIRQVLATPELLAIEVVNRAWTKPEVFEHSGRRFTEVLGTDCHNFRPPYDKRPGSRCTWVKMAQPTLEGVRLALLDGQGVSIRRSDASEPFDPFRLPEHFIEAIEIEDFRVMGRGGSSILRFNPAFNALIGGRGTGKSTVVHAARLALRRADDMKSLSEDSEPRRTFDRFLLVARNRDDEGGLTDTGRVVLTFLRDGVRHRLTWRQDGAGVAVEEWRNDQWALSASQAFGADRFPVRMFSQGQIAALCEGGSRALLDYVDEAAGARTQKEALVGTRQRFLALRAQIRDLEGQLKGRDSLLVQRQDVERKLQRFEQAQHAKMLKNYQTAQRQRGEVQRQLAHVAELAATLSRTAETLETEVVPDGIFHADTDREPLAAVARLVQAVRTAKTNLLEAAQALKTATQIEKTALEGTAWHQRLLAAEIAYADLQRQLAEQGIHDPAEYGRLVQQKQRLEADKQRLEELEQRKQQLEEQAQTAYGEVKRDRLALTKQRGDFLKASLAASPYVRITVVPWGRDPRPMEASLRALLGVTSDKYSADIYEPASNGQAARGLVAELLSNLPEDEPQASETVSRRINETKAALLAACWGAGRFGAWFNKYLAEQSQKRPELPDHVQCWFPEDGLQVEYSRRGDGTDFQPITQASAGQRAAAMLAFLLAEGTEPLILDQPEDDLDNYLIYDLVVRQIRENKQRRQIIIVTHNPNIVVNGDAEMLHALDFRRGQCQVVVHGALQDKTLREEVCRVMEGGRDALDRRYQRLGKEV